jgi:hypothetical protein
MNIWSFHQLVSGRLLQLNLLNVWVGQRLAKSTSAFWRGVGSQNVGWGMINLAIAVFGSLATRRRLDKLENPMDTSIMRKEASSLRRALWINTGLDVFYIAGGWRLARKSGAEKLMRRGIGIGIVLQGALLFGFDLIHALRLSDDDLNA